MKILYTRVDGGLSVVSAAKKEDIETMLGALTDEQYKAHVWERSVPIDAINPVEIDDSYVLPDREFRGAWKQNANLVEHDLEKARDIQLDKARAAREPKLVELDKAFMLALEKGESTAVIVAAKQRLRDITEPLKVAPLNNIEDVKNLFPQELRSK